MRDLTEQNIEDIQDKIEWEGLDYYLENWGPGDLDGTELAAFLGAYLAARTELIERLRDAGVDV